MPQKSDKKGLHHHRRPNQNPDLRTHLWDLCGFLNSLRCESSLCCATRTQHSVDELNLNEQLEGQPLCR